MAIHILNKATQPDLLMVVWFKRSLRQLGNARIVKPKSRKNLGVHGDAIGAFCWLHQKWGELLAEIN